MWKELELNDPLMLSGFSSDHHHCDGIAHVRDQMRSRLQKSLRIVLHQSHFQLSATVG